MRTKFIAKEPNPADGLKRQIPSSKLQRNAKQQRPVSWLRPRTGALLLAQLFCALSLAAQIPGNASPTIAKGTNDFSSNLQIVYESQQDALQQAKEMLESGEGVRDRAALEKAIQEMERAQAALEEAVKSPEKLPAALTAEQTAYQALLKLSAREFRMQRGQRGQNGGGGGAGEPTPREMSELEMQQEQNRYETESQAAAPQDERQRAQSQLAERLKQLAQRQQDLNQRLRELQTALQAARTEEERADIQRQLKRLQEEQRQMLASVDEMRQQLAQQSQQSQQADNGSQAQAQQQLDQARNDMERAAQNMEQQAASEALAAGTRAQEAMQNLQDDLRKQTSSQFSEQMRQLRNQARDLTRQQEEIARGLDSLNDSGHQTLDNTPERQRVSSQMEQQLATLTNLLAQMRGLTEKAEVTEPLLSKQLYDTLRRADQMRTEELLKMGAELTDRGFLPQASQVERSARTNIVAIASGIERAAESVLGSEADALRFAQKELDELTRLMEREIANAMGTNGAAPGLGANETAVSSNGLMAVAGNVTEELNTNGAVARNGQRQGRGQAGQEQGSGQNNPQNGEGNPQGNQQANAENGGQDSASGQQDSQQGGQGSQGGQQAGNQTGAQNENRAANRGGNRTGAGGDRLRQIAVQLGAGGGDGGPITGGGYVFWTERLRDVEQAVTAEDLRNRLTVVRERVSALRAEYRQRDRKPDTDVVRGQILTPMTQVRVWLQQEIARREKSDSLVPLDREPVPDNYAEMVRKYYEKLGSAQ